MRDRDNSPLRTEGKNNRPAPAPPDGSGLRFEPKSRENPTVDADAQTRRKKKLYRQHYENAQPTAQEHTPHELDSTTINADADIKPDGHSPLQFDDAPTSGQVGPRSENTPRPDSQQKRKFEAAKGPPDEAGSKDSPAVPGNSKYRQHSKQGRQAERLSDDNKLNKSKLRTEKTGERLNNAHEKLANQKPPKKTGPVKAVGKAAKFKAWQYTHGKIHQVEHENVGTEAAHKTELMAEGAVRGGTRFVKNRIRTRPARNVRKWERKDMRARANYELRKTISENPEMKNNAVSRYWQKRKYKKQYQKQAYETAKQGKKAAQKTARTTEKIARKAADFARRHPVGAIIILLLLVFILLLNTFLSSISMMGSGILGAVGGSSYLADDSDIDRAELYYTELETDLQIYIQKMKAQNPGYDDYLFSIGDISHNPYELMAFLTSVYGDFSFNKMKPVLDTLFNAQYKLETDSYYETRTVTKTIELGASIGDVRTTAYCACSICCGKWANGITASGTVATANRTIAVDAYNPIVPMGTKLIINGIQYTVEDTGNLAANGGDIDVFFDTHQEAIQWGRQTLPAYLADGNEQSIEVTITERVKVLEITLASRNFTTLVRNIMDGQQLDHYNLLMQTKGNRQYIKSPFGDTDWLSHVSSKYGYRVHPISGAKNYHKGLDIGMPEGTEILAGHGGTVTTAAYDDGYGYYVVLDDGEGLVSKYAHCSVLLVSAGQSVEAGDVIAKVGNTGQSTGPHLHLEIIKDGQYLNPLYFAVTNDYDAGPSYGNPGAPMGDGSYEAMIAEAEKYLGYPYVWGGSSPSTSFDCSGFVCWVINQSGVGSVGRTTAQGLYNHCTPVSAAEAKPGDLVFFTQTYSTTDTITHVGIYVGGDMMIHCGNPISYVNYVQRYGNKYYSHGRLPGMN